MYIKIEGEAIVIKGETKFTCSNRNEVITALNLIRQFLINREIIDDNTDFDRLTDIELSNIVAKWNNK